MQCSGERDRSFEVIKRLADFSPSIAVDDEKFLNSVTTSVNGAVERSGKITTPDIPLSAAAKNGSKVADAAWAEVNRNDSGHNNSDNAVPDAIHEEEETTSSSV